LKELVDKFAICGEVMLDVVLFVRVFSGEGVEDGELVAESGFISLEPCVSTRSQEKLSEISVAYLPFFLV